MKNQVIGRASERKPYLNALLNLISKYGIDLYDTWFLTYGMKRGTTNSSRYRRFLDESTPHSAANGHYRLKRLVKNGFLVKKKSNMPGVPRNHTHTLDTKGLALVSKMGYIIESDLKDFQDE